MLILADVRPYPVPSGQKVASNKHCLRRTAGSSPQVAFVNGTKSPKEVPSRASIYIFSFPDPQAAAEKNHGEHPRRKPTANADAGHRTAVDVHRKDLGPPVADGCFFWVRKGIEPPVKGKTGGSVVHFKEVWPVLTTVNCALTVSPSKP